MSANGMIAMLCGAGLALVYMAPPPAHAADAPREVHGSADAFAMPGVALAWGVLRGDTENETSVVIRIDAAPPAYAWIEIVGKDPFTQREDLLQPAAQIGGPFDLKVSRARFADFPRTEIRLWPAGSAPPGAMPALTVYYLGIPDTTPEVQRADELDRSLAARLTRARDESARKTP
jgi:hypothetical protein